jgi:hypothetical protein
MSLPRPFSGAAFKVRLGFDPRSGREGGVEKLSFRLRPPLTRQLFRLGDLRG